MPVNKDIIVPKEIMGLFPNAVRIVDKKILTGIWPVDVKHIRQLQKVLPELVGNEGLARKFNIAVSYKGKTMKPDFEKAHIELIDARLVHDIWIHGIPVPWIYLKKVGIDNLKFEVILTPS